VTGLRVDQRGEMCSDIGGRTSPASGVGQDGDDLVVAPERGDVLERQVHGPGQPTRATQRAQLVELSLAASHGTTLDERADPALGSG
jgi:hypothetical protein